MKKLSILPNSDLTEYVIQVLQRYGIETIRDFMTGDEDKLCKATNLTRHSFSTIKYQLLKKYGPTQSKMSRLYLDMAHAPLVNYRTKIMSLDSLLENDTLCGGCLLEVCGFAGVGKTQFCLTLIVNFATHYGNALFIDTKTDYIGSRIIQIMKARNVSKLDMGQIMQKIKIERTFTADGVINILENLLNKLENGCSSEFKSIKLIIIDSLAVVWLHMLHDDAQKIKGKYMLTYLANLMRKLSKQHFIVFIFVNLLVREETISTVAKEHDDYDREIISEYDEANPQMFLINTNTSVRPALGTYWIAVPTMRLSMEGDTERERQINHGPLMRTIRVLKSCYTRTGRTCTVMITNAGVV